MYHSGSLGQLFPVCFWAVIVDSDSTVFLITAGQPLLAGLLLSDQLGLTHLFMSSSLLVGWRNKDKMFQEMLSNILKFYDYILKRTGKSLLHYAF